MKKKETKQVTPEEWWAGLTPEDREAIWKVMRMANDLFEGEKLFIQYVGGAFVPSLDSDFRSVGQPGRTGGKICPGTENPKAWWESRSSLSRGWIREGAQNLLKLKELPSHAIQFELRGPVVYSALAVNVGGVAPRN